MRVLEREARDGRPVCSKIDTCPSLEEAIRKGYLNGEEAARESSLYCCGNPGACPLNQNPEQK